MTIYSWDLHVYQWCRSISASFHIGLQDPSGTPMPDRCNTFFRTKLIPILNLQSSVSTRIPSSSIHATAAAWKSTTEQNFSETFFKFMICHYWSWPQALWDCVFLNDSGNTASIERKICFASPDPDQNREWELPEVPSRSRCVDQQLSQVSGSIFTVVFCCPPDHWWCFTL